MRFICEKTMLLGGLNVASRTVSSKNTLTVLEGILCRAANGLSFTGYNTETAITYLVDAQVTEPGECVFPARLFGDIIRRLPEGEVTVVVDDNMRVSIRAGFASFSLIAQRADEFPSLPDVNSDHAVRIPQKAMKELISGTIFSVADNQSRPVHTGVLFEVTPEGVTAVAVDGHRLARRCFHPEEPLSRTVRFVVPASSLKEVEKILGEDGDVSFTVGTRHILYQIGPATLICRLLEGDFLDWRKVLAVNSPIKLVANVAELSASVGRMGLIVSEKFKSPVCCVFSDQVIMMHSSNTLAAASDRCSVAGDGKELEIGFNVHYLMDALRVVPGEEVTLELTDKLSPVVLTPVDDKYDFSYMILPVRIRS